MNNTPYISVPEMLAAPTGINWATIPDRDAQAATKQAEYLQLARRGTSWVNTTVRQILTATQDQDVMMVGGRRCAWQHGRVSFITRFSPIISVDLVEISTDGVQWTDIQGSTLVDGTSSFSVMEPRAFPGGSVRGGAGALWLRPTYTHGFANTSLAAAVSLGNTSLTVLDATGISKGLNLRIYDIADNEDIFVANSYNGGTTIPLVSPLLAAHPIDTRISAMPPSIREAALQAVVHYVRVRGRSAITIQPTGGARSIVAVNQLEEFTEAKALLQPFNRVL